MGVPGYGGGGSEGNEAYAKLDEALVPDDDRMVVGKFEFPVAVPSWRSLLVRIVARTAKKMMPAMKATKTTTTAMTIPKIVPNDKDVLVECVGLTRTKECRCKCGIIHERNDDICSPSQSRSCTTTVYSPHSPKHTSSHVHAHVDAQTHSHARTHTHTRTHAHTHAHHLHTTCKMLSCI